MKEIAFYEVISAKGTWMGSYSPKAEKPNQPNALEQAQINLRQSGGKIFRVFADGEREEI
jgi:hypothetical protein